MRTKPAFQPHLAVNEIQLATGAEWKPKFRGWCVAHIQSGISYWQDHDATREVHAGSTLVFSAEAGGVLRASQLSAVVITCFSVETEKLLGLLSLREQHFLKQGAARGAQAVRVISAADPVSARFKDLRAGPAAGATSSRLRLIQLFMELFESEIGQDAVAPAPWVAGRERLRKVLNRLPASEFVELSVSDLAPMMSCSPRHLNRLFREELGASFREKQIELRLAKACELLVTSDAKVVEVALESGYQSSSVFSGLFKKHLGVSPGQWRRQRAKSRAPSRVAA